MKKLNKSNLFFGIFIILLLIPTSRNFIQVNLQRLVAKITPPSTIEAEKQKTLSSYNIQFKGINTPNLNLDNTKGKIIFINFWATWCPPCIAEMPDLQTLYDAYNKDIIFAFVTNDNQRKINTFLTKEKLTLPIYKHLSKIPKELDYNSLPTTFIIDKKGKIILHEIGAANWNSDKFHEKLNSLINTTNN